MTTNYNQIFISQKLYDEYKVGDTFSITSGNWRINKFNGLKIESKGYTYGFPTFTMDWHEWNRNLGK